MVEIKSLIVEMQESLLKTSGVTRYCEEAVFASMNSKPIKIITGFRRCGKSFLVKQIAKRLVDAKVYMLENILYLNFEHYRLREINSPQALDQVFKLFKREIAGEGKVLLIFDEIQNVKDWDAFIRTVYEVYGEELEIILTGSNSELLSVELGSNLAGRFIEFSLLPFSFREYLKFFDIEMKSEKDFLRKKEQILKYFSNFKLTGSLPEICSVNDNSARYSYLQGIISKVILDDIIERFRIKNVDTIEKILYFLNLNVGNIVSFANMARYIKNTGTSINNDTTIAYVNSILKTFSLYEICRFDWKAGRVFETSKKYYSVDTGVVNSFDHTVKISSKLLENIVFLELKRRGNTVYFGGLNTGKEIDFISKSKENNIFTKYQVTQELTEENKKRELENFIITDEHLKKGENYLLILDGEEGEIDLSGHHIIKKNLVKWLLGV